MTAGRAIEPIAAILALRIRQALPFFAFGTLTVHLFVGDIFLKKQTALCTHLGITSMIWRLTPWCRTNVYRMTGVTPVFTARHFFTNRTLFH